MDDFRCYLIVPLDDEGENDCEYGNLLESPHVFTVQLTEDEYNAVYCSVIHEFNLAFDQLIDIYEDDVTKADDIPEAINIAEYWLVRVKSESEKKAINKILSALKKANEVGRRMDWVL